MLRSLDFILRAVESWGKALRPGKTGQLCISEKLLQLATGWRNTGGCPHKLGERRQQERLEVRDAKNRLDVGQKEKARSCLAPEPSWDQGRY